MASSILRKYLADRHLAISDFGSPEIELSDDGWYFSYTYLKNPEIALGKNAIGIFISFDGSSEYTQAPQL
jgi:hypothetical protein